jgi:hypothetical protein
MELQEFSLIGLIGQLRYALSPLYPDVRGRIITQVKEALELPEWGWGDEVVNFHNADRSWTLLVGGREARAQFARVEDTAKSIDTAATVFESALSLLDVKDVAFVGARTIWVAAADSFEEVRDYISGMLDAPPMGELIAATGTPLSDIGWTVECHSQDPRHSFRVGPGTREQFAATFPWLQRENFPDSFLFLDLDRNYHETVVPAVEAVERWRKTAERNLEIAEAMSQILTGTGTVR